MTRDGAVLIFATLLVWYIGEIFRWMRRGSMRDDRARMHFALGMTFVYLLGAWVGQQI